MRTFRSWEITSWPEVFWKAPTGRTRMPVFHHMGTDVRAHSDEYGRVAGDTVWAARVDATQIVGVAWEWIEVKPGVPAIRDPNGFVSNARFLSGHGVEFSELQGLVQLNRIAHGTPWQAAVRRMQRASASPLGVRALLQPLPATRRQADPKELRLLRELVANLPCQTGASRSLAAA